ncbi:hypothetical protein Tco_0026593, partial [Tanacetum coccineum]
MLRIFSKTLVGAAKRLIKSEPIDTITTWELLKSNFLAKYCPPLKTARQIKKFTTSNKKLVKFYTRRGK